MIRWKKSLFLIVIFLFIFGGARLYYYLTDDFHKANITYPMPYRADWEFDIAPAEYATLTQILNQKFHYLGKGAQVYAFASEDGKYVIKFFKFKHLKPSPFVSLLPSIGPLKDIKTKNNQRRARKLNSVFDGHAIAFSLDRENSGLVYVHLNPTNNLHLQAHLVDKIGFNQTLDLDPIVFVIQRKGKTFHTVLSEHLEQGDVLQASERASQILHMYMDEYKKGLLDKDHGISHNTGFIDDKPFHLDVGKFSYDPVPQANEVYAQDLRYVATKMNEWVQKHYPRFATEFKASLDQHLDRILAN